MPLSLLVFNQIIHRHIVYVTVKNVNVVINDI